MHALISFVLNPLHPYLDKLVWVGLQTCNFQEGAKGLKEVSIVCASFVHNAHLQSLLKKKHVWVGLETNNYQQEAGGIKLVSIVCASLVYVCAQTKSTRTQTCTNERPNF